MLKLNHSQQCAIDGEEDNKVVIAPAGSGKTATLIEAIIDYKTQNPNDKVTAITFTRAAAQEMLFRLEEKNIKDVIVKTIHSWSRDILIKLSEQYNFKIYVMEAPQIMKIVNFLVSNHRTKVNPEIVYTYITGNKKMDITENLRRTLDALETKYVNYKRVNELYDFTDYPLYLLKMLKKYKECIDSIDAFFVDEFQDVDPVQLQIFDLVVANKKFYIGDPKQCIYFFRGSAPEAFKLLKNFTEYNLDTNYRSYQEIVDYADTVYKNIFPKVPDRNGFLCSGVEYINPSSTTCIRGKGADLFISNPFSQTKNKFNEWVDTKSTIQSFLANNAIILCRTNRQVRSFESAGYYNATTIHQSKGLEYDSVIVIDEPVKDLEDLNTLYVALTRAKDRLFVGSFPVVLKNVKQSNLW